jgi:hypothetical protein
MVGVQDQGNVQRLLGGRRRLFAIQLQQEDRGM